MMDNPTPDIPWGGGGGEESLLTFNERECRELIRRSSPPRIARITFNFNSLERILNLNFDVISKGKTCEDNLTLYPTGGGGGLLPGPSGYRP